MKNPNDVLVNPVDMSKLNKARLNKQLDTEYRFSRGIMTMRRFLASSELLYKNAYVREYARKKRNGEYKKLNAPVTEYSVWVLDPNGKEYGIDITKMIFDWLSLPTRKEYEAMERGEYPETVLTDKDIIERSSKIEEARPAFFYDVLLPAIEFYISTGAAPITPPILGAMTELGAMDMEHARFLVGYWNS